MHDPWYFVERNINDVYGRAEWNMDMAIWEAQDMLEELA